MAQKSRTNVQTAINSNLPDNITNEISPADTRGTQTDLNDSGYNLLSDDADSIALGSINIFMDTTQETAVDNLPTNTTTEISNLQSQITALEGSTIIVGNWSASSGSFPTTGNTAPSYPTANINQGYKFIASSAGTIDGIVFAINDQITALVDTPSSSTFSGAWIKQDFTDIVLSVNSEIGAVVLDTDDIAETATKKYLNVTTQTFAGAKTFSSLITGELGISAHRVSTDETASFSIGATHKNKFVDLQITGAVIITVGDSHGLVKDDEVELFWATDSGTNSITLAVSGSQTIISEDSNLGLSKVGSGAMLKFRGSNSWVLIGSIIA